MLFEGRIYRMENTPRISVIIPVYNVEKYLGKCLSSLVEQTFRDFEIIAVNDGSTDHSLEILRRFEENYDFITVIDQENRGISLSRNRGMDIARGEYLCFVDSDDFVAPCYLQRLYELCEENKAEIACCSYYFRFVNWDFIIQYPFRCKGIYTRKQAMKRLLHDFSLQSLVWNKLFKRSLFEEKKIRFPKMCFEDLAVMNQVFASAERVAITNEPLYYYNKHSSSTLATINAKKINDFLRSIAMVRTSLEDSGEFRNYRRSYWLLTQKTALCCRSYLFKIHREKKAKGLYRNIRNLNRAVKYCNSDTFMPVHYAHEFADSVLEPGSKELLEEDYIR